jgi:hypothetical protein
LQIIDSGVSATTLQPITHGISLGATAIEVAHLPVDSCTHAPLLPNSRVIPISKNAGTFERTIVNRMGHPECCV